MAYQIVVPISGGKDSQACLHLAREIYQAKHVLALFCDTKFEHSKTYRHVEYIKDLYGVDMVTLNAGDVPSQILKHGRFPSGTARFCTKELKIVPSKKFYKKLATEQGGFQVWYGMRSAESTARLERYRGKLNEDIYPPHEVLSNYPQYLYKLGVTFRLPVLDMAEDEIFHILDGHHNPLYDEGFDRVGCFPCAAGGDASKEKAFAYDQEGAKNRVIMMALAHQINKPYFNSKGGALRNTDDFSGCAICSI